MRRLLRRSSVLGRWTCSRALSTISPAPVLPSRVSTSSEEDSLLRDIFDSPNAWKAFNTTRSIPTGLFLYKELTHRDGFDDFLAHTLTRAQTLLEEISEERRPDTIIQDLDRLSDTLCAVADSTAFLRAVHPDLRIAKKANETFANVIEYMNGLNQHQKLYELTARATPHSREERAVQRGLLHDFEQSGMRLPPHSREKFVSLSSEINELEQRFTQNAVPAEPYIELSADDLQGVPPSVLHSITRGRIVRLPTSGHLSQGALRLAEKEKVRRRIWEAQNTGSQEQIQTLERLLEVRRELASFTRYNTYAEAKLEDKMAKTPGMATFKAT